jgi:hypothetical protein
MSFSKKATARSIKEIIEDSADSSALSSIALKKIIEEAWDDILGDFSSETVIKKIDNGILKISVESAAIRQEILARKNTIISSINDKLGKEIIKKIIFI